jgi:hypothetical protein
MTTTKTISISNLEDILNLQNKIFKDTNEQIKMVTYSNKDYKFKKNNLYLYADNYDITEIKTVERTNTSRINRTYETIIDDDLGFCSLHSKKDLFLSYESRLHINKKGL